MIYHSGNRLIDPHLLFAKAHLRPKMHVADFGCGRTGHLVFPAAPIVGEQGIIYAVDILKDVLDEITKRARLDGILNIHPVWSDIERLGGAAIPAKSLDLVFLVNILYHAKNLQLMLDEASRLLKNKARLLIVDWTAHALPFGPDKSAIVDFKKVKAWGQEHGFIVQEEFAAGQYHQGLVLYKHE